MLSVEGLGGGDEESEWVEGVCDVGEERELDDVILEVEREDGRS